MKSNIVSYYNTVADYITAQDVADQIKINVSDPQISEIADSAMEVASKYLGYPIRKALMEFYFDDLDEKGRLLIPARVLEVTSVQYYDENGTLQTATYNTSGASFGNYGYYVTVTDSPTSIADNGERYKVTCKVGFEKVSATADESKKFNGGIRRGVYMAMGMYDNRQNEAFTTVGSVHFTMERLLNPYKINIFV